MSAKCIDGTHATVTTPDGPDSDGYLCAKCRSYVCVNCGKVEVGEPLMWCDACGRAEAAAERMFRAHELARRGISMN